MNQTRELSPAGQNQLLSTFINRKTVGKIVQTIPEEHALLLKTENGLFIYLEAVASNLFRIQLSDHTDFFQEKIEENGPYMIEKKDWTAPQTDTQQAEESITLHTNCCSLSIEKESGCLCLKHNGKVCFHQAGQPFAWDYAGIRMTFAADKDEVFYGLGLRQSFPHNGETLHHTIQFNHWEGKSVPFFISNHGYGLFLNTTMWDTTFSFQEQGLIQIPNQNEADFFLFAGNYQEILERYSELTGKPIMPPKWSFGYWHGKYGYRTQEETLEVVQKFRDKKIPLDLLFLDLHWRGAYSALELSDLSWDLDCFPEPVEMIQQIHQQHVHLFGHMNTSCLPYARDFTNPDHIAEWNQKVPPIIKDGFDGCMVDAGEGKVKPGARNLNFMSWDIPEGRFHNGMLPREMANLWGLLYNKTAIGAMQSARPNERIFGLSRAATAGSQRYSLIWSGDHSSTWEEFEKELTSGLNMSLSGLPFWTYDIGGIEGMPSKELFVRWFEAACFTPVMRTHGRFSREPWLYGKFVEQVCRDYLTLRMRLVPFLYSLAHEMYTHAVPMVRPISWHDPQDDQAAHTWDQWMLGDAIMACAVHQPGIQSRKVYLPQGKWMDLHTGEILNGNSTVEMDAPLERIPLLLREGGILPLGEPMQYVDEKKPDFLTIMIFPAENKSEFTLYEDNGTDWEFLKGDYTARIFTAVRSDHSVEIDCLSVHDQYRDACTKFRVEVVGCNECEIRFRGKPVETYPGKWGKVFEF